MRIHRILLALVLAAAAAAGAADEPSPYDGNWTASFPKPGGGGNTQGRFILKGETGSWRYVTNVTVNVHSSPCLNRDFPLTIEERSATQLRVKVEANNTLHGCTDRHITLHPVDATHLEGQFGDGTPLHLSRE